MNLLKEKNLKNELLSGLTVSLALVPEAIAFAIVAGVNPLVGLYAAFIVGMITAIFGGRPGMISGATGALAIVMVALVADFGIQYLFAAVILMGIIQILIGVLKLGKLIRILPEPVIIGFVNGLAVVIFISQLEQFKFINDLGEHVFMSGPPLFIMIAIVAVTLAIIYLLPRITKVVPAALVAIVAVTIAVVVLKLDTKTVGDIAKISGSLPVFNIPNVPFTFETLKIIFPYALIFAIIGLTESLLTLTLIDGMTDTKGNSNRECIGQGLANILSGIFSSMGGCAMIGQSIINIKAGGRNRISGIAAASFLLIFILFAGPLIEMIPIAALIGVMFSVVIATFEWSTIHIIRRIPLADAIVIVAVTIITVISNLAIAVIVGIIISALTFAWEKGNRIDTYVINKDNHSVTYKVRGVLFFGSSFNFIENFQIKEDPQNIIIDFESARILDYSGTHAISQLTNKYKKLGKHLEVKHLSVECLKIIEKSHAILTINIVE